MSLAARYGSDGPSELTRLQRENERLRAYIQSLDGKHVCIQASDGFIDDGIIVAADVLQQSTTEPK